MSPFKTCAQTIRERERERKRRGDVVPFPASQMYILCISLFHIIVYIEYIFGVGLLVGQNKTFEIVALGSRKFCFHCFNI